jgi:NADH-quinone oxidoreductase subunit G
MCLVEIEKMPKLQIACNTRVSEGMVVHTRSERVKRAQGAVLEFLLINHPVDCPICDQAGECKLQDYYMDYDRQPSRVPLETKVKKGKAIEIGPLVMLDQERCILCTRCTRFLDEITKTSELGVFARGDHCEIDLFPGRRLDNPYSGNVVDICPVGALTNRDFRFRARVWYLQRTPSVCPTCATGCNIDVHHRSGEMFRFRPRFNADVNRYWMCDEGRLSYKRFQGEGRLYAPAVRVDDGWQQRSWDEALALAVQRLRATAAEHGGAAICGVVSAQATNEEAFLFRRVLATGLGARVLGFSWSPPDAYHDNFLIDADRNPNTAGLRALGLPPIDADALARDVADGRVKALVLLRADIAAGRADAFLDAIADRAELIVVLDTHFSTTAQAADVLLPIATFAETEGTFVNRSDRVQNLRQAIACPGSVRTGWELLGELSATLAGGTRPVDSGAVLSEIAAVHSRFAGLTRAVVGLAGTPLQPAS